MTHSNSEDSARNPPDDGSAAANQLEARVTELLRGQPLLRAPASLAQRVFAVIEQRRRSAFQRWPLVVRIAFVVLAGLAAHLSIQLMQLMGTGISAPRPPLAAVLAATALDAARQMPVLWSYGAIGISILIYGGIFGIGVAIYRLTLSPPINPK